MTLAACSGANAGDPGNRRFNALRRDGAVALRPPMAVVVRSIDQKAHKTGWIGEESWAAPRVLRHLALRPGASREDLVRFYQERLPALGWQFDRMLEPRTWIWFKQVKDWTETLAVTVTEPGGYDATAGIDAFLSLDAPAAPGAKP